MWYQSVYVCVCARVCACVRVLVVGREGGREGITAALQNYTN